MEVGGGLQEDCEVGLYVSDTEALYILVVMALSGRKFPVTK